MGSDSSDPSLRMVIGTHSKGDATPVPKTRLSI